MKIFAYIVIALNVLSLALSAYVGSLTFSETCFQLSICFLIASQLITGFWNKN